MEFIAISVLFLVGTLLTVTDLMIYKRWQIDPAYKGAFFFMTALIIGYYLSLGIVLL